MKQDDPGATYRGVVIRVNFPPARLGVRVVKDLAELLKALASLIKAIADLINSIKK